MPANDSVQRQRRLAEPNTLKDRNAAAVRCNAWFDGDAQLCFRYEPCSVSSNAWLSI